jgi:hypothetical protein
VLSYTHPLHHTGREYWPLVASALARLTFTKSHCSSPRVVLNVGPCSIIGGRLAALRRQVLMCHHFGAHHGSLPTLGLHV